MQVTQVEDHVTHAVIGGSVAKSFGMSDSAEFFNILSNTLYSDKPLAVGREVLCNAWDAHIAAGCTDKAVQVTLNRGLLTIRDFGTGIAKDDMHPIYCVYGNSTKAHDGKQTGGFGLGCKAPFAYTDHFEVTSFNSGFKTVYSISKSSGEVGGKPGMIEVVSIPTQETGLQVSIILNNSQDEKIFSEIIKRIAASGEMNIELNGDKLPVIPFSEAKNNFLIINRDVSSGYSAARVFVRYGNVIYPVPEHDNYKSLHNAAVRFIGRLAEVNRNSWHLVLMAAPHSISVTPSRESLSMADYTVTTLHNLLQEFLNTRNRELFSHVMSTAQEHVQQTHGMLAAPKLLHVVSSQPLLFGNAVPKKTVLSDFSDISRAYLANSYPDLPNFYDKDVETRLRSLVESGFGSRGKIQSLLKILGRKVTKQSRSDRQKALDSWFTRRISGPLVNSLVGNKDLTPDRLLVYGVNGNDGTYAQRDLSARYANSYGVGCHKAKEFRPGSLNETLAFLRNMVVLAYSRTDVADRLPLFPEMRHWFGSHRNSLVYLAPRSETKVKAAREHFTKLGYHVIDMTVRKSWEPEPVVVKRDPTPKVKKPKGLPTLSNMLQPGSRRISVKASWPVTTTRIDKPEFVVKVNGRGEDRHHLGDFSPEISALIVELFGSRGAAVFAEPQMDKCIANGAMQLGPFIWAQLKEEFSNNPLLLKYFEINPDRLHDDRKISLDHHRRKLLEIVLEDAELQTHFKLAHTLTVREKQLLVLWRHLLADWRSNRLNQVDLVKRLISATPISTELVNLAGRLDRSSIIEIIDHAAVQDILNSSSATRASTTKKDLIRTLLIQAIEG